MRSGQPGSRYPATRLAAAGPGARLTAVRAGATPLASDRPVTLDPIVDAMRVLHRWDDDDAYVALVNFLAEQQFRDGPTAMLRAATLFVFRWRQAARASWSFAAALLLKGLRAFLAAQAIAQVTGRLYRPVPDAADQCARLLVMAPHAPPPLVAIAGATG
jgi:hypothetical protein